MHRGKAISRHQSTWKATSEKHLVRWIHAGLYLILLTPLILWSGFQFPHLTGKVLGFQILVELVAACTLILILVETPPGDNKTTLFYSALFVAMSAMLGCQLLSSLVGVDLSRSLWGVVDRQDGFVFVLHCFAWTLLVVRHFRQQQPAGERPESVPSGIWSVRTYLVFSYSVSVVVAMTAIWESPVKFDGFPHPVLEILSSPLRLSGVFGNPFAIGPYLLFHFYYGLYFLLTTKRMSFTASGKSGANSRQGIARRAAPYVRWLTVAIGEIVILLVIAAGQTRGVIFGLVLGLFVTCALLVFGLPTRRLVKTAGVIFVLCLVVGAALAWRYRDSSFVTQNPLLRRLTHISATESSATSARMLSWGSGIRGLGDHPVLGWGFDNVYYVLSKYYDPRHVQFSPLLLEPDATWFDKSHNFFIDLLVERGIVGFLAYLALLGVIAVSLWRMPDRRFAICVAGAMVAYLASLAVAFDSFGSLFGFFLTLGCVGSLGNLEPVARIKALFDRKTLSAKRNPKQIHPVRRTPVLKILLVLVLLGIGLYLQVEMAIANHRCLQAQAAFAQDPGIGVALYQDAFAHFSPYEAKEKLNCAYLIVNSVINKRQSSQAFEAGPLITRLTREALAAHPRDVAFYMVLNDMYNGLAIDVSRDYARDAEAFGKKALELSPNRQDVMFQLGRTYVIQNQAGLAVELNRRMLRSADFPLGHWLLGLSLLQNNQRDEAKQEIRKAIGMGYSLKANDVTILKGLLGEADFSEMTTAK